VLQDFRTHYQAAKISKQDIFYYVYGVLHSPEYKQRFASDLKKMLPRIPLVQDFWAFSQAGRELADWHIHYETIEPYPLTENVPLLETPDTYRVQKMQFAKKGKEVDKTTLVYNSQISLNGIPLETYDYIVNGKPALEWIIERYAITTDKDSGITNNPNHWSDNPRYIIDLVKRIVRVSVETVRIVKNLPALNEQK
jgi:predicted helicase